MRLLRGCPAGWALSLLLLAPQLAPAAWNNVFQVTCNSCRRQSTSNFAPVVTFAAPSCPQPCPQTCCSPQTSWVQRSYYQPVTSFQQVTNFEPVTTMRTSFFFEPVTSYHYSSFFDPCSGCCQKVATPTTSFRLRSQCNAVTSYVARVSLRPVTTYRQSCYWEQVQLPCSPSATVATPAPATAAPPVAGVPELNPGGVVEQQKVTPPPVIDEKITVIPPSQPLRRSTPVPPAPVKAEHIASIGRSPSMLTGQVVLANYSPRSGAKVTFVSATNLSKRQPAMADDDGRFQVDLPAGEWYVYVDNKYHNAMNVRGNEARNVMVLSR